MNKNWRVALLRGINVGTAKRVAMADLKKLVEGLGCTDVKTLLNSGNVVYTESKSGAGSAERLEKAIATKLKVTCRVMVLTGAEVAAIIDENPLLKVADNPSKLHAFVLSSKADAKRFDALLKQRWAPEALAMGPRVAYMWCPAGQIESPLAKAVARELKDSITARNWATMLKLHALVSA